MIADHGVKTVIEMDPEFGQAFGRALESRIVSETDETGVARVIAVGDNEVSVFGRVYEFVEEMVVGEGITLPEEVAIETDEETDARTGDGAVAVIDAGLLGRARVVNIAEDVEFHRRRGMLSPGEEATRIAGGKV